MKRTAILNVVGLADSALGENTPLINQYLRKAQKAYIRPALPAVTCTAQSTYLTGVPPTEHGIVGNGWYNRELAEVQFWKQSNHLVQAPKIWDELRSRGPGFTCAKLFWWYNMYSTADYTITPRPIYPADGRKVFDIYTWPFDIRYEIKKELGEFPFPSFWGPAAGVRTPQGEPDAVSKWIAASAKWIDTKYKPSLSLVYLPHLDYNLQRFGPADSRVTEDYRRIDAIVGDLINYYEQRQIQVVILSEYGITRVNRAIHLNRIFRQEGWLTIKEELGLELLDAGASKVFAVADHQVAHIYLNEPELSSKVVELLKRTPGVGQVYVESEREQIGLNHARAGDIVAVADESSWFTYYYWLDDKLAPDFARTVDIHRKPGYDPVELFLDPAQSAVKLKIAWRLLKKKLGFRMLMDLIPLDASLVKGSHGCVPNSRRDYPLFIAPKGDIPEEIEATDVYRHLLKLVLG